MLSPHFNNIVLYEWITAPIWNTLLKKWNIHADNVFNSRLLFTTSLNQRAIPENSYILNKILIKKRRLSCGRAAREFITRYFKTRAAFRIINANYLRVRATSGLGPKLGLRTLPSSWFHIKLVLLLGKRSGGGKGPRPKSEGSKMGEVRRRSIKRNNVRSGTYYYMTGVEIGIWCVVLY